MHFSNILITIPILAPHLVTAFAVGEHNLKGNELAVRQAGVTIVMTAGDDPTAPSADNGTVTSSVEAPLPVATSGLPATARSLKKRQATSRAINQCPAQAPGAPAVYTDFIRSSCLRDPIGGYSITCADPDDLFGAGVYNGACASSEICIDKVTFATVYAQTTTAFCVSHAFFVDLSNGIFGPSSRKTVKENLQGISGNNYAFENVLFGAGGTSDPLNATSRYLYAVDAYANVLSQSTCNDCSSVELQPLPTNFDHFTTVVNLPNGGTTGFLYAALVSLGG